MSAKLRLIPIRTLVIQSHSLVLSPKRHIEANKCSKSNDSRILQVNFNNKYSFPTNLSGKQKFLCSEYIYRTGSSERHFHFTSNAKNAFSEERRPSKKKLGMLKLKARRRDWREAEEVLETAILSKGTENWKNDDWIELSDQIKSIPEFSGSWETLCIIRFCKQSNLSLGFSLVDFVESQSEKPPAIFTAYWIALLGRASNGDAVLEDKMKKYYDDLISNAEILDFLTMEVHIDCIISFQIIVIVVVIITCIVF